MKLFYSRKIFFVAPICSLGIIIFLGAFVFINDSLVFGIDFDSGLNIQARISGATVDAVQAALEDQDLNLSVRRIGGTIDNSAENFMLRLSNSDSKDTATFQRESEAVIRSTLESSFGNVEILESTYMGPRFSQTLRAQTFVLITATLALVLLYLWFRFHIHYAVASVVALLHDICILFVFFGISGIEISSATVAAVLTILGYSLNDTIIIFDRIRENLLLIKGKHFRYILGTSIGQSLSRTIITSLTTLLAVIAIAIYTQGTIRYFALSLIVGIVVGTYSSLFIASPILLLFQRGRKQSESLSPAMSDQAEQSMPLPPQQAKVVQNIDIESLKREIGFREESPKKKKRNK